MVVIIDKKGFRYILNSFDGWDFKVTEESGKRFAALRLHRYIYHTGKTVRMCIYVDKVELDTKNAYVYRRYPDLGNIRAQLNQDFENRVSDDKVHTYYFSEKSVNNIGKEFI